MIDPKEQKTSLLFQISVQKIWNVYFSVCPLYVILNVPQPLDIYVTHSQCKFIFKSDNPIWY